MDLLIKGRFGGRYTASFGLLGYLKKLHGEVNRMCAKRCMKLILYMGFFIIGSIIIFFCLSDRGAKGVKMGWVWGRVRGVEEKERGAGGGGGGEGREAGGEARGPRQGPAEGHGGGKARAGRQGA